MYDRNKLRELARAHGVQASYHDGLGQLREASDEAVVAVLKSLGVDASGDLEQLTREAWEGPWKRRLAPVTVAWNGNPDPISTRVLERRRTGTFKGALHLEQGESVPFEGKLEDILAIDGVEHWGEKYLALGLPLRPGLKDGLIPFGRHRLELMVGDEVHESTILSAPEKAVLSANPHLWGLFMPMYAMHTDSSVGVGDFGDLAHMLRFMHELGGEFFGTLPLCSAFLKRDGQAPFEPSPYSPVSRLFWNELYLDVAQLPEFQSSERAQRLHQSADYTATTAKLRDMSLVDYERIMAHKRRLLEELTDEAFRNGTPAGLASFLKQNPTADTYAKFRATTETRKESWHTWPDRLRGTHSAPGELREGDYDPAAYRYHLYVQWRLDQQVHAVSGIAKELGQGLYLDMPLGVHPDGFDAWQERHVFMQNCSAGAPPDPLFIGGQDWGFRPLHPVMLRETGYDYLERSLRAQMQNAGIVRMDHVMGLHRIYCVPHGFGATEGLYLSYQAEELYAVLNLESAKHGCMVIGEDLGTVPPEVREAMDRHRLQRMYIGQFETRPHEQEVMPAPPANCIGSLNTHDTPPFKRFYDGDDSQDRMDMGLIDQARSDCERKERREIIEALGRYFDRDPNDAAALLGAMLGKLAESDARMVMVNLEDLWLENEPQNVPGTSTERPNWRVRSKHSLENIMTMPELCAVLRRIDKLRRRD